MAQILLNSTRCVLQKFNVVNFARSSIQNLQNLGISKTVGFSTTSSLNAGKSWHKIGGPHLFSYQVLKKNYEVLPLLIIVGGGVTFLLSYVVVQIALTRDDVRYKNSSEMPYENTQLENARKRKFVVFNQNYDTIDELKSIYKDLYPEQDNQKNK